MITYTLQVILPALVTLILGLAIWRVIGRHMDRLTSSNKLPRDTANALRILTRWILSIVIILFIATIFGIEMTSLWAALSALLAMIAIGLFAGWSLISSLLAAIVLMIWRPFRVGQHIELLPDGVAGRLSELNMMFATLVDDDGAHIRIPNSQMLQKLIRVSDESAAAQKTAESAKVESQQEA